MMNAWKEFNRIANLPDDEIDLARAALLLAASENRPVDIEGELEHLDAMARGASAFLGGERGDPLRCVNALSEFLFDVLQFWGNLEDYYDPRNSYLDQVMARRTGIPITLSLLYVEVGRRLGIPLAGVGMPGHFLVKHLDVDDLYVDPFYGGILLNEGECAQRLREITRSNIAWEPEFLEPVSNREFITRILRNLKGIHLRRQDHERALTNINWILTLLPHSSSERRDRGVVHYHLGNHTDALIDLREYLDLNPAARDERPIRELIEHIETLIEVED